jgi:hypothetical protein
MIAPALKTDGSFAEEATLALAAGYAFEQADRVVGELGKPLGVASYKPYHSTGEDFLHSYLGMLGIPIDLQPEFPADANTILLTECAKADPRLVERIQGKLQAGKTVVITSGLLRALLGKGIEHIVELQMPERKAPVKEFQIGWFGHAKIDEPMLIPQIQYLTNDAWEEISCLGGVTGYPLLLSAQYGGGMLYVLTIPDNFSDLYRLPAEVLNRMRETLTRDLPVRLEGPGQVALFVYDNDTFIVESFRESGGVVRLVTDKRIAKLRELLTGRELVGQARGDRMVFEVFVRPGGYSVFTSAPQ